MVISLQGANFTPQRGLKSENFGPLFALVTLVSQSHQKIKLTFRCKNYSKSYHLPQEFPGRDAVSPPLDPNALKGVAIVCSVSKTSEHKCEVIRGHNKRRWHFIYPVQCLVDLPEYLDTTCSKGSQHHTGTWEFQVRGFVFYSSRLSILSIGLLSQYC